MIDPRDILVIVFEGRRANSELRRWVERFPNYRISQAPRELADFIGPWRNHEVLDFLAGGFPWLLMVDDDMVPVPDTEALVHSRADVAGAAAWRQDGTGVAHGDADTISAAALKISRRALLAVTPPWFAVEFDPTGSKIVRCECKFFCDKMRAAGFLPVTVGRIGHLIRMVVIPSADNTGPVVRFQIPDA